MRYLQQLQQQLGLLVTPARCCLTPAKPDQTRAMLALAWLLDFCLSPEPEPPQAKWVGVHLLLQWWHCWLLMVAAWLW